MNTRKEQLGKPSGAWSRTDYVSEYYKLEAENKAQAELIVKLTKAIEAMTPTDETENERNALQNALREMIAAKGRYNTQTAMERLIALLPENQTHES